MKVSIIQHAFQLASTIILVQADTSLTDFGRILHLGQNRIERRHRRPKTNKGLFVENKRESAIGVISEVASSFASKTGKKGNIFASKASSFHYESMPYLHQNFEPFKHTKASKLLKPQGVSLSSVVLPKSSKADDLSYEYFTFDVFSKSSKAVEYLSYEFGSDESKSSKVDMSYDFSGSFVDIQSMNFDIVDDEPIFDFHTFSSTMIANEESGESVDDVFGWNKVKEEEFYPFSSKEGLQHDEIDFITNGVSDFGRLVFEYLSKCSGANLDTQSCLSSSTIHYLTSIDYAEGRSEPNNGAKRRFLQTIENDCMPLDIQDSLLTFVLQNSKDQCTGIGHIVTDAEYDLALHDFTTIFRSESCWVSLCDESSSPSDFFFKILFEEAARCARIMIDGIPDCVLTHIFDVIFSSDNTEVKRLRRALQESTSSCEQPPSQEELVFFVTFLLNDATSSCTLNNTNLEADLETVFGSLLTVFGASQCWGVKNGCDQNVRTDDTWFTPAIQMDGTRCDFEPVDEAPTRSIELSYYYILETSSSKKVDVIKSIEEIERSFIAHICSFDGRRTLEAISLQPKIISIDSNPLDTISSHYGCNPESFDTSLCFVVESTMSILVPSSQDESLDYELQLLYYEEELRYLYDDLRVEDPNVISIEYVGPNASSSSSIDKVSEINATASNLQEESDVVPSIVIGLGGFLLAVGALIASINKFQRNSDDPIHADEKEIDHVSDAQHTSDLTYSNSLEDRSELSSFSLMNRYCLERAAVVLAEEEESNWQRLGINSESILEVFEEDIAEEDSI